MGKPRNPGFYCTNCGNDHSKWAGRCTHCGEWNTLEERPVARPEGGRGTVGAWVRSQSKGVVSLEDVKPSALVRIPTGVEEFDRVLGGGLVPGAVILLGGEPGIGKSTILTQVGGLLAGQGQRVLYASGEENAEQVRLRADRIGQNATKMQFVTESSVDAIIAHAEALKPSVLVVDSAQALVAEGLDSAPSSVSQVRECATRLNAFAKAAQIGVFLVGHVTKDGTVAGPKTLEHIVDAVIQFSHAGGSGEGRIMRATKNRFGSVDEIGVFRMHEHGLEAVSNPSEVFLADRAPGATGSAVVPILTGRRPLLIEVQGLVSVAAYGTPQRLVTGYRKLRLVMLTAVLEKRAGLPLGQCDAFVNVVGGMEVADPSTDLAVAAALASSTYNVALPEDAVFIGEVGLGGEVRRVPDLDRRLHEAAHLGFKTAFAAARSLAGRRPVPAIECVGVESVADLIRLAIRQQVAMGVPPAEALGRGGAVRASARSTERGTGRDRPVRRTSIAIP